jgi:Mrp family chromosome partitioning ATPase
LRREPALVGEAESAPIPAPLFSGSRRAEPRGSTEISIDAIADAAYDLHRMGVRRIAVFGATPGMNISQTAIKLARALAEESRVILVGLASGETAIRAISNEPSADGLAELAHGMASFRAIITKDRLSPLHLISPGHASTDRLQILSTGGITMSFEALAHSYDHVVVDAGAVAGAGIDRIAEIAPHAVLVGETASNVSSAREQLLAAGIVDVTALVGTRGGFAETAVAA